MEEGSNDILTMALGTPEHGGRVRGVGAHVAPRQFFHVPPPKRFNHKQKGVEDARYKDLEEKWRQSEERARQQEEKLNQLMAHIASQQSGAFGSSNASGSGVGGASNTPHAPYAPPPPTQAQHAPPPPTWTSYAHRPPSQLPLAPPPPTQAPCAPPPPQSNFPEEVIVSY